MKRSVNGAKNTYSRGQLRTCRSFWAFYLSDAGYETSRAGNSAQGISKALAERPDLIITDLNLPDMNAVDATVILKQDPATVRHSHCCTYRHGSWRMEN